MILLLTLQHNNCLICITIETTITSDDISLIHKTVSCAQVSVLDASKPTNPSMTKCVSDFKGNTDTEQINV